LPPAMSALMARISLLLALAVVIQIFYYHARNGYYFPLVNEEDYPTIVESSSINSKSSKEHEEANGKGGRSEELLEDRLEREVSKTIQSSSVDKEITDGSKEVDDREEPFVIDEKGKNYEWNYGFVGSPDSTMISINDGGCKCELLSTDCLDALECLLAIKGESPQRIYEGMIKREAIKMLTLRDIKFGYHATWYPIGKSFQLISQGLFREFMKRSRLFKQLANRKEVAIDHSSFDFCVKNDLLGRNCVIKESKKPEEKGSIEEEALKRHGNSTEEMNNLKTQYQSELQKFRKNRFDTSAYDYLLLFSHFSKIGFNLRSHILDAYKQKVKTIPTDLTEQENIRKDNILRVALHIRRGDSCGHSLHGYERKPSPLDSIAQVSSVRMCYDTSVYMEALSRIQMLAKGRHLVVYVATDHLLDLMREIAKSHSKIYHQCTWKYVYHSRSLFNYSHTLRGDSQFIEFSENHGALGETALMDVWHLSHGEVFVGHLGSRFGKLSWWQAIARHNTFVPFFTVDGHSVCCDIDEACGRVAPAIVSMENCLTFSRDHSIYKVNGTEYWKSGAFVRYQLAADEIAFRRNLDPSYQPPKGYNSTYELFTGSKATA